MWGVAGFGRGKEVRWRVDRRGVDWGEIKNGVFSFLGSGLILQWAKG